MTASPFNPTYIQPGTHIGLYVVRDQLGHGSGSVAYLADSPQGHAVVLKMSLFPRQGDPTHQVMHERFLRQVDYLCQLRGVPGVAEILAHDCYPDTLSGHQYLVQEWVEGRQTIIDWAAEPHPLRRVVLGWMLLASTCGEMGRRNICHRDFTPDNILVGPSAIPKIVDLNSAIGQGAQQLTATGAKYVPGKPRYSSPELCLAILKERATGRRQAFECRPTGDLHALGAIFYRVLTGEHPFDAPDESDESLQEIAHVVPTRPSLLNAEVPFGLEKVTMKLLQKEPAQRYQSGFEVAADLEALLENTSEDWELPFQMPHSDRHSPLSRPRKRTTSKHPPARTPSFKGSAAPSLSADIDQAEPGGAIPSPMPASSLLVVPDAEGGVLSEQRKAPLEPAAVAMAIDEHVPLRARAAWPRSKAALAGGLVVAAALALGWEWHAGRTQGSSLQQGVTMVLTKAKAAVVTGAAWALACAGLGTNVRAEDEEWFAKCSPEARQTVSEFGMEFWGVDGLRDGPFVIRHRGFHEATCEVKDGPVVAHPAISGVTKYGVTLVGRIKTTSDRAYLRFDRIKLGDGLPDDVVPLPFAGREGPVCAMAWQPGSMQSSTWTPKGPPGLPKVDRSVSPEAVPESELHPGYLYVNTCELEIVFAK